MNLARRDVVKEGDSSMRYAVAVHWASKIETSAAINVTCLMHCIYDLCCLGHNRLRGDVNSVVSVNTFDPQPLPSEAAKRTFIP